MIRFSLIAFVLMAGTCPVTQACQICIPFPEKSAADHLIEAEVVLLAREDPDRSFHFRPIEVLKGDPGKESIDLFLNSGFRRLLAVHPERSIVLVGKNTGDGKLEWSSVGVADQETEPVVRAVVDAAPSWKNNTKARFEFFAARLGHENSQIREQAHLEVARAPYREIRQLGGGFTREEIYEFLGNMRTVEWHALYILLLAQSGNPEDAEYIRASFRTAAESGSTIRLAAWATALIEIEEAAAIDSIEHQYFRNAARKPEELKAVLQAVSVHGTNGHTHLRDRIVTAYGALLENHLTMAPQIVGDLTAWKRTDLAEEIGAAVARESGKLDFSAMIKLRAYAKRAGALK